MFLLIVDLLIVYYFVKTSRNVSPPLLTDCSDSSGCCGGLLPVLAASSRGAPVGRVWLLPPEPGVLCASCGSPLSGLQQLVC